MNQKKIDFLFYPRKNCGRIGNRLLKIIFATKLLRGLYLAKSSILLKSIYPDFLWKIDAGVQKKLYLTFDDGPIPGVTCEILKILEAYKVKATFFSVGDNIVKYPALFKQIIDGGNSVGNHTYNHLNGWDTTNFEYLKSITKSAEVMPVTKLFRPPYGKIKVSQAKAIAKKYKVIMWDVLSGDFDKDTSKEDCLLNVLHNSEPGSIIVFHDSLKAKAKVLFALPRVIKHFLDKGFVFSKIEID